jgi:hypothetical protein
MIQPHRSAFPPHRRITDRDAFGQMPRDLMDDKLEVIVLQEGVTIVAGFVCHAEHARIEDGHSSKVPGKEHCPDFRYFHHLASPSGCENSTKRNTQTNL